MVAFLRELFNTQAFQVFADSRIRCIRQLPTFLRPPLLPNPLPASNLLQGQPFFAVSSVGQGTGRRSEGTSEPSPGRARGLYGGGWGVGVEE